MQFLTGTLQWIWAVNQGWARANPNMRFYHGCQHLSLLHNQLFIAMSLIRYGFNPQDPEAWVEEPVLDAMDFNEFELEADWEALDQDIAENMAAD
eukprot:s5161_g2.t1